jgi:hypothetical protein
MGDLSTARPLIFTSIFLLLSDYINDSVYFFIVSDTMRLINATTMQLERFDDDTKIPPYAILSHTWGSAEVSLQQFENTYMSDHIKKMLGYDKIVKACKQAFQDGHAYVWVDTCEVADPTGQIISYIRRLHRQNVFRGARRSNQ